MKFYQVNLINPDTNTKTPVGTPLFAAAARKMADEMNAGREQGSVITYQVEPAER